MQLYVAGFLFSNDHKRVALVEKKKFPPGQDWSENPYNAIGGKIEEGELPGEAMRREFREETGVDCADWQCFAQLDAANLAWRVFFFKAFNTLALESVSTVEEEPIVNVPIGTAGTGLAERKRPNVRWLIPMALDPTHVFATATSS